MILTDMGVSAAFGAPRPLCSRPGQGARRGPSGPLCCALHTLMEPKGTIALPAPPPTRGSREQGPASSGGGGGRPASTDGCHPPVTGPLV